MGVPTILQRIIERKAERIDHDRRKAPMNELRDRARDMDDARGFEARLREVAADRAAVIAEIKKASPSQGVIRAEFEPAKHARSYESAGAACLSVLTEQDHFQGDPEHLKAAREACDLPVLRKDFIVEPWQVWETRAMGADAMLLIVAALGDTQLEDLHGLGREAGLDVLVEVHEGTELARAARLAPTLLGVNNRNLETFEVDLETCERLKPAAPPEALLVAESGIHAREHVERLRTSGIHAFLVGEAFMRADDPGDALEALFG